MKFKCTYLNVILELSIYCIIKIAHVLESVHGFSFSKKKWASHLGTRNK